MPAWRAEDRREAKSASLAFRLEMVAAEREEWEVLAEGGDGCDGGCRCVRKGSLPVILGKEVEWFIWDRLDSKRAEKASLPFLQWLLN
mmetsp:Transcript_27608/g.56836  ORF Transcript_27608/g.56836 Transcript_27608/m.56836 type:complete len:88 (+) Transcript_27608:273-536(+)